MAQGHCYKTVQSEDVSGTPLSMSGWRRFGLVAAMVAAACGPPSAPPQPEPPTPPAPSASLEAPTTDIGNACREQVAGLEEWLRSLEQAGLPLALSLLDEGSLLVERPGPVVNEPAPLLHVTKTAVYLDGVDVDVEQGLERELTQLIELRRNMMPESPFIQSPRCHVAIDRDVPWQRVVAVFGAASRAGVERITLLFRDSTRTVPGPPPSPIDREIERMSRGTQLRRQQIIAELLAYVYQDCPQGLRVIASMGLNPVADFKQVILDEFPAAIGACSCAPDDASLKALHWAIFGNPRPTSGITVALPARSAPAAPVVEAAADAPWSETQELFASQGDGDDETPAPVELRVREPEPPAGKKAPRRTTGER